MARINVELPSLFSFSTIIPVRISDVNYGGHVGNDAILSIIHEARMQYLQSIGYSELNFEGAALIMSDVGIEFKGESFYGDKIFVSVSITDIGRVNFDMVYKLEKNENKILKPVAYAKTGMVCFNYSTKKVIAIPPIAKQKLQ
jgi:acyl-CoA thioester hydrolase